MQFFSTDPSRLPTPVFKTSTVCSLWLNQMLMFWLQHIMQHLWLSSQLLSSPLSSLFYLPLPFHSHSLSSPFETPQLLFILPNPLISNICKYIPSSPFSPFDFFIQINSFPTFMESVKLSCYSITFSDKDKIFFWILYASLSVPTQMLFYFLMKNVPSLIGWCID